MKLTKRDIRKVFRTLEQPEFSEAARKVAILSILVILCSSMGFVLETMPVFYVENPNCERCPPETHIAFWWTECFCIAIFSIEYLVRVFSVHAMYEVDENEQSGEAWSTSGANSINADFRRMSMFEALTQVQRENTQRPTKLGKRNSSYYVGSNAEGFCSVESKSKRSKTVSYLSPESRYTLRYVTRFLNIIDFLSILPFYLEIMLKGIDYIDLSFLRLLRLARIFRVLKLAKYNAGMRMIGRVMDKSLEALYLLAFFLALGVLIFGSMIYVAESGTWDADLQAFVRQRNTTTCIDGETVHIAEVSPFASIPDTFWWVVVTSTTVGYGDVYPVTTLGKMIGALTMLSGILVLALPITIIGSNFSSEYEAAMKSVEAVVEKRKEQFLKLNSQSSVGSQDGEALDTQVNPKSRMILSTEKKSARFNRSKTQVCVDNTIVEEEENEDEDEDHHEGNNVETKSESGGAQHTSNVQVLNHRTSTILAASTDILTRVVELDINRMSPLECQQVLARLQEQAKIVFPRGSSMEKIRNEWT